MLQKILKYKYYLLILLIGFGLGKMSMPAKTEISKESTEIAQGANSQALATTKTTKENFKKGTRTTTESSVALSASSNFSAKSAVERQKIVSSLFGIYIGAGVPLDDWQHPFASGIITYNIFAFSLQSDLKSDHRIAGHIGLLF